MEKERGGCVLGRQEAWVLVLSATLALGELLPLSVPQFPPLSNEGIRPDGDASFYDPFYSMNKEEPQGKATGTQARGPWAGRRGQSRRERDTESARQKVGVP